MVHVNSVVALIAMDGAVDECGFEALRGNDLPTTELAFMRVHTENTIYSRLGRGRRAGREE